MIGTECVNLFLVFSTIWFDINLLLYFYNYISDKTRELSAGPRGIRGVQQHGGARGVAGAPAAARAAARRLPARAAGRRAQRALQRALRGAQRRGYR